MQFFYIIYNIVQSRLGSSHKQCTQLMDGSICKRWSSHKDVLHVVNLLSSKDVVDFHWFTDCHPEAIFDVNKCRDLNSDLFHRRREERSSRLSSDHRQFLFEPGSARYFSTPPVTTVWSNYQTIFDDFFKVYFTKMATITKCSNWLFSSVQLHWVIFNLGQWLNSVDFCHVINHSSLWLVNRVTAVEYR